ncbi:helix-turn-helix domain-containing protein [Clostridium sp.]|uniref:helix-turn-helix domain-containing protein n=1 Tax=Clostridium sp. TaxID=1506 RepID=UPI001B3CE373|nr:helix-turn-helix domain-containing protein [Clostridium sp.]MBP3915700.1 helix-turn-helix domain-containing protein [Clostridium sp.]
MSLFNEYITFKEAAEIYNMDPSTFKKAVYRGSLVSGKDCVKFGKTWIVRKDSIEKVFKNQIEKKKAKISSY